MVNVGIKSMLLLGPLLNKTLYFYPLSIPYPYFSLSINFSPECCLLTSTETLNGSILIIANIAYGVETRTTSQVCIWLKTLVTKAQSTTQLSPLFQLAMALSAQSMLFPCWNRLILELTCPPCGDRLWRLNSTFCPVLPEVGSKCNPFWHSNFRFWSGQVVLGYRAGSTHNAD